MELSLYKNKGQILGKTKFIKSYDENKPKKLTTKLEIQKKNLSNFIWKLKQWQFLKFNFSPQIKMWKKWPTKGKKASSK